MTIFYAGIEGGTTNSRVVLVDAEGKLLGLVEGPHTNQWILGIPETVKRLVELIEQAKQEAHLSESTGAAAVGLCLSGVDTVETQELLIKAIREHRPNLADKIHLCNDSLGTLKTVTDAPGLVLISGTGSICKYVYPDLKFERVGGLGYMLGDGGSAYWISHQVILKFLEAEEGLVAVPYSLDKVREAILQHFGIKDNLGLLYWFYEKFDKALVARLCKQLSELARDGDQMCLEHFRLAGVQLGRHVMAAVRRVDNEMSASFKELPIICCGSVFKSWDLLQDGFQSALVVSRSGTKEHLVGLTLHLLALQVTSAYGACRLAAQVELGVSLPFPAEPTRHFYTATVSADQSA